VSVSSRKVGRVQVGSRLTVPSIWVVLAARVTVERGLVPDHTAPEDARLVVSRCSLEAVPAEGVEWADGEYAGGPVSAVRC
jgi:hypothetical protein